MKKILSFILVLVIVSPLMAQYGKNKVNYDNFDWKYIQSQNFDIYYYEGGRELAEFSAPIAEEQIKRICNLFNWRLRKRISLLIYNSHNDFQQTNVTLSQLTEGTGGFTELYKNRAVVQFTGDYHAFWHVIRHELLHVIVNEVIYGGSVQNIVSGRIRLRIPLWMNEGLAEYISSGWDTDADMIIRDIALSNNIPPIKYLNYYLAYKGGQSVYNFIDEKYGTEKIGEIWQHVKSYKDVEKGFEEAIGMNTEDLTKEWHKWVKKSYWTDIAKRDEIDDFATQLTDHVKLRNYFNSAPAISPNGTKVAILSNREGYVDVYLISAFDGEVIDKVLKGQKTPDLEELKILTPELSWAPNGKDLVLATKSGKQDALIFLNSEEKKNKKVDFENIEQIFSPSWSNDGKHIVFIGLKDERRDLYIYTLKNKKLTRLTNDAFSDYEPSWSQDDRIIYFASQRGSASSDSLPINKHIFDNLDYHQSDIFSYDLSSKKITRLTDTKWNEHYPIKTNTQNSIIYTSDFNGISNFFVKNLDTNEDIAITNVLTGVFQPSLSKDDTKLVFAGYANSGWDVFSINNPLDQVQKPKEIPPTRFANQLYEKWGKEPKDFLLTYHQKTNPNSLTNDAANENYSNFIFNQRNIDIESDIFKSSVAKNDSTSNDTTNFKDQSGEYVANSYKTKYTLDLVDVRAGYNTFWGFQGTTVFSFSDVLGNHRFAIGTEMYVDLENSDYYLSYQYLTKQTNYSFTAFHSANFYAQSIYTMWKWRNYGVDVTISKPLSIFSRYELGTTLYNVDQSLIDTYAGVKLYENAIHTILPRAGFVYDNSLWGYLNPIDGIRARVDFVSSPKYSSGSLEFYTAKIDFRTYFKINRDYSFAFRFTGGLSEGANAQHFFLGGEMNWLNQKFARNHDFTNTKEIFFSDFVTPLRGARYYERVGTRYFLTNFEFRYPFIKYLQLGFPVPMILGGIQGITFLDLGTAWFDMKDLHLWGRNDDRGLYLDDLVGGFGFGTRVYLGYFVLKIDTAWRFDLDSVSKPKYYFSLGLDF